MAATLTRMFRGGHLVEPVLMFARRDVGTRELTADSAAFTRGQVGGIAFARNRLSRCVKTSALISHGTPQFSIECSRFNLCTANDAPPASCAVA